MKANRFTRKEKEFIRKHYPTKGSSWVASQLNMEASQVKNFAKRHKLSRINYRWSQENIQIVEQNIHLSFEELSELTGETVDRVRKLIYNRKLLKSTWTYFTEQEDDFIRKNYRTLSNIELSEHMDRTSDGIRKRMELLGLKRTPEEVLIIRKRMGKKGYKPGNKPHNTKYNGYISTRVDSQGTPYKYIRVSEGKFELLHRYNWIKKHGPIPDGKILRSIDGSTENCDPENWELVDRASHLDKNTGRTELTDKYVIAKIAHRSPELKEAVKHMPELIELKRTQLKLRRTINESTETSTND